MSKVQSKWTKLSNRNKSHCNSSAIALSYKTEEFAAPQVSAKGSNLIADEMKKIARRYGVPFHRSDRLIKKLKKLEVSSDIPQDLYADVAKVFINLQGSRRSLNRV